MTTIASRDLRNHTAAILGRAAKGETITVTTHGEPVAQIGPVPSTTRAESLSLAELLELVAVAPQPDQTLVPDLAWISGETTDDLDPLDEA